MKKESGQIILILLLVMTVALGIGLSIIQRSLSDISTSTKVEQSSRAFSAAEAGIEKALQNDTSGVNFADTGAEASVYPPVELPEANQGLEYPPIGKEEIAHFWLADLNSVLNPPEAFFTGSSLDIYWGSPNLPNDRAAIEINLIVCNTCSTTPTYQVIKYYFDPDDLRRLENGFSVPTTPCSDSLPSIPTSMGQSRQFYCRTTLSGLPVLPFRLMTLRTRLLYTSVTQPIAVLPIGSSLPKQAKIYTAVGTSGTTQRTVQLFKLDKVVPFYFDYAIFSAGPITK